MEQLNSRAESRSTVPRVTRVLETCLYVEDVERSARFYQELFGFPRMDSGGRLCALDVAPGSVLCSYFAAAARSNPS